MKNTVIVIGVLLLFAGCVKRSSWQPEGPLPEAVIVDGLLTDEMKSQTITLTRPVADLNKIPEPVTGASVIISNQDSSWQLTENPGGSGFYKTPDYFIARLQKNYTLLISLQGKVYSAKATMEPGSVFGELKYAKSEENGLYYVDWVANAFNAEKAAMWELLIDWSGVPGYQQLDSLENHARMLFYTLPTLDVSEIFAPRMEKIYFPAGTLITERRYSLTPQHAEFVREMLLETNWTGGLFASAPANVGTNLSNGAFGFFGVCAVNELSVIVTP